MREVKKNYGSSQIKHEHELR